MKVLCLLLSIIILSGCTQAITTSAGTTFSNKASSDGYRFIQKEYETLQPGVEFVLMKNPEEYREIMYKQFGPTWKKVSAFTSWNKEKATCKIYIKDPAWKYEPELIGHEVAHCIWGRFHDGDNGLGDTVERITK